VGLRFPGSCPHRRRPTDPRSRSPNSSPPRPETCSGTPNRSNNGAKDREHERWIGSHYQRLVLRFPFERALTLDTRGNYTGQWNGSVPFAGGHHLGLVLRRCLQVLLGALLLETLPAFFDMCWRGDLSAMCPCEDTRLAPYPHRAPGAKPQPWASLPDRARSVELLTQ
jgi:hypothetical protein